jgi:hypothetical protein
MNQADGGARIGRAPLSRLGRVSLSMTIVCIIMSPGSSILQGVTCMDIKSGRLKLALALTLPLIVGIGPCARMPGGVLNGAVVSDPIQDWSTMKLGLCAVESRLAFPHSVHVACWHDGPNLYVGCMRCKGKMWSSYVSDDPRGRIKIGGKIYPVTFNRIAGKDQMRRPWEARWAMFGRTAPAPPVPDGYWLWHLTSR